MWGITDGKKLYRLTFSKTLAEHICEGSNGKYHVRRYDCIAGRNLADGELSKSGIYGIVSAKNGLLLRASLIAGVAELYRDSTRSICEAYLVPC